MMRMYAVSFYDADPDAGPEHFQRLVETYPRHRAYLDEFAAGGEVLMIGTFGDPATAGLDGDLPLPGGRRALP